LPLGLRGLRLLLLRDSSHSTVKPFFALVAFASASGFAEFFDLSRSVFCGGHDMSRFGETAPPFYYIAYIDEAGDPGIKSVQPNDPNGASEWLSVGATLIRANYERDQVQWVQEVKKATGITNRGAVLHFRNLQDYRRDLACQCVAGLKLRAFAVVSNKINMEGHRNLLAEKYAGPRGWFYNWCLRVIIERITDCVERSEIGNGHEPPRHVKLVFSERGGVKYHWLNAYIELLMQQAQDGTTVLPKRVVKWRVMHPKLIEVVRHNESAGAQLADCIASAFYAAVHSRAHRWNTRPAELLKPCMATKGRVHCDYGVTLQPWMWRDRRKLLVDQKKIFRFYGYDIR
jgi:Protein of unknown function (DUF3800)